MDFFTTIHINELIKDEYISFIYKHYNDILLNPNKYIKLVEDNISRYLWWWYVKLLNSWTTALQFWLLSLWVKKWDEVILPANTYSATAISIINIWAKPVFADINLDNYTINYKDIEDKITNNTKVIIPVHLYWYNCDMNNILKLANKYKIKVLEDVSHAFWWEYYWKKLWTLWNIWIFSCHNSKNFWTFWNWGIFYTDDYRLYNNIDNYIFPDKQNKNILYSWRTPANIWVFDSLSLYFKLKYIKKIIDYNINLYYQYIEKYKETDFIFPKLDLDNNKLHLRNFTVLSNSRNKYIENFEWKQYYSLNLQNHLIFKNNQTILENTKYFFDNNLSLNFYYWKKIK